MLTLVVYDIHDDKRRQQLARVLGRFGLTRVQYSAFRGDLNPNDKEVLIRKVTKYVEDEIDCIFVIPLCGRCLATSEVISKNGRMLVSESSVEIV
ncbi:MAG: CRISPR-associated endonuclease Cas2 [Methanomassiliicoccales archaeon]|nr:CRISPR-associated endonuclease Cas2 [Methanomassiliicoccales archaeon]